MLPMPSFVRAVLNFGIAWTASWKIGVLFPKLLMMPMIVGYMFVGFLCGHNVTGMLHPETLDVRSPVSVASLVNTTVLAFIAFSAGSELHVPSLGVAKLKEILSQILMMGVLMILVGTPIIFTFLGILPHELSETSIPCQWSAALLLALAQWAGSVIEVLAIYHETRGAGPVTQMMIGTTMLLDMVVLVFFAIGQNIVISACPLEGTASISAVTSVIGVVGSVVLWAVAGSLLGMVLQVYLCLPPLGYILNALKPLLVLVTGGISYYGFIKLNQAIPTLVPGAFSLVRIDPLLVCMIAAIWANHVSVHRDGFREIMHDLAPMVMPPFFTIAGATLDLNAILDHVAAPPVLFTIRFVALAVGSFLASHISGHSVVVRNHLWMTLQSQSGVTLGLVAQMQMGLVGMQPWAKGTAASIIGCVVLNQLVGPTLCRFGIRSAGESNEEDDEITIRDVAKPVVDTDLLVEKGETVMTPRRSHRKQTGLAVISKTQRQRARTGSFLSDMGEMDGPTDVRKVKSAMSMTLADVEEKVRDATALRI